MCKKQGRVQKSVHMCKAQFSSKLMVRIHSNWYDYFLDGYILYIENVLYFYYSTSAFGMYTLYISTLTNSGYQHFLRKKTHLRPF